MHLLLALLACAPPTEAPPAAPTPLDWRACDDTSGETGPRYRCTTVEVPLRWDEPLGEQIELFIKKRTAKRPSGRGVWLLPGGPGFSGLNMESHAELIGAADDTLDLYMPDHRGTGWSAPLACPAQEALDSVGAEGILPEEFPACIEHLKAEYGERLGAWSTTETARDLSHLITRADDAQAFVLGVSYGTWLAHRYLQLFPDQADGVILDSMCAPGACTLSDQDVWEDPVVRSWLEPTCAADPVCSSYLHDPWATLQDVHARLEAGHCEVLGLTAEERRANLRAGLSSLFLYADFRDVLPAFIHRVDRCNDDDAEAIYRVFDVLFGAPPTINLGGPAEERGMYNQVLAANILLSELWETPAPAAEELSARYDASVVGRGVSAYFAEVGAGWPTYTEPRVDTFAVTSTPMLMLQSRFDNLTPLDIAAAPMEDTFAGPHQHFVVVETGSHNVLMQSRMASDPNRQCGVELLLSFLADPTGPLDERCTEDLLAPSFAPSEAFLQAVFGTDSLWGGE